MMQGKASHNFIIDALMFLTMTALAGTGFLNRYVLLSGQAGREMYGQKVEMGMLGISKHTWQDIHLYLSFLLLGFLLLHILLHWRQIASLYRRLIPSDRVRQRVLIIFMVVNIILVIFPFIIPPTVDIGEGFRRR